ncbi:spore coat protein SP96-like [Setaria italica]|uniref:spore coat protein SP96-like n=1 Tax=Setaria italica TaxID=4555 RepID=UPI000350BCB3|nr:spore coat protein SP96-like [Setaria italica]
MLGSEPARLLVCRAGSGKVAALPVVPATLGAAISSRSAMAIVADTSGRGDEYFVGHLFYGTAPSSSAPGPAPPASAPSSSTSSSSVPGIIPAASARSSCVSSAAALGSVPAASAPSSCASSSAAPGLVPAASVLSSSASSATARPPTAPMPLPPSAPPAPAPTGLHLRLLGYESAANTWGSKAVGITILSFHPDCVVPHRGNLAFFDLTCGVIVCSPVVTHVRQFPNSRPGHYRFWDWDAAVLCSKRWEAGAACNP